MITDVCVSTSFVFVALESRAATADPLGNRHILFAVTCLLFVRSLILCDVEKALFQRLHKLSVPSVLFEAACCCQFNEADAK